MNGGVYNIYLLQAHEWYEKKERLEVILKPLMYSYEWSETSEVTDERCKSDAHSKWLQLHQYDARRCSGSRSIQSLQ
jgi:hypothetical protein